MAKERRHWGRTLASLLVLVSLTTTAPAQASLLRPLLMLMRPQLEQRLTQLCLRALTGGVTSLEGSLQRPCQQLAGPASTCLINETDASGRSLGVINELISGRVGNESEVVIKRCVAKLLKLPPETLQEVPLKDLPRRFGLTGRPSGGLESPQQEEQGLTPSP
ncbi:hypothetical protein [Cyanobium sp. Morenito 9A2]|uniref:hypothetical protein n=1 Tax=Cyanobium sp. Morenito 9A2 TaxID=2823718 RepID=UPI0020CF363F|nr:hypothetical protein [Cyanobium sp. Morenito 9A2]MCP9851063.1 hypothetical protein [Cyanobium sp. Morenito 9A2]